MQQSEAYRCLSTIVSDGDSAKAQKPFGMLTAFNDETLASGKGKFYYLEEDTFVILMPLVGMLEVETSNGNGKKILIPEEIQLLSLKKGQSFYVSNPYEKDLVNYLQIRLKTDGFSCKKSFGDFENNRLQLILKAQGCFMNFGVFDGRKEAEYRLQDPKNCIFAFVINGAFELQNRLLESRDGLALWETNIVELEALSENSIILLMEIHMERDHIDLVY